MLGLVWSVLKLYELTGSICSKATIGTQVLYNPGGTFPCLHSFLGKQDQVSSSAGRDLQSLKISCVWLSLPQIYKPSLEVYEFASWVQREMNYPQLHFFAKPLCHCICQGGRQRG